MIHDESHGNADLVAHFFRRAFDLLRNEGLFGLIATNTIGQGDTRSTGLRWICTHGGTIFAATRRKKWPGQAAVVISVVHVHKGPLAGPFLLDGRGTDHHRLPLPRRWARRPGETTRSMQAVASLGSRDPTLHETRLANEGKSFIGACPRHGLHIRRHDTKAWPLRSLRCTTDRQRPAQRRAHLSLHRRRGGQRQPDARPPPLRHQLRRDDRGRGATMAGLDADRGGEGEARARLTSKRDRVNGTSMVAICGATA